LDPYTKIPHAARGNQATMLIIENECAKKFNTSKLVDFLAHAAEDG